MTTSRRNFLAQLGIAAAGLHLAGPSQALSQSRKVLKPRRIAPGNTIGLVNPAGATFVKEDMKIIQESLAALDLKAKAGKHALDRYGYLGGKDADRAADVNAMFADPDVDAILCIRGGWGCNRILDLLDYEVIRRNPKAIIGYSDITSLLVAINAMTGLVTFHGPVGISTWNRFSLESFKGILFDGNAMKLENPKSTGDNLAQTRDRVETITPGKARGRLAGGNLTVLTAMIGSRYLPDWKNCVLFLEDDGEKIYRVDRMLTQLKLAGVLQQLSGFIFGKCTKCDPGEGYGSLTLEEVLADHIAPLGIPAWYGAMIGHIENKFTVPLGIDVEIDSVGGTIQLLESAVL